MQMQTETADVKSESSFLRRSAVLVHFFNAALSDFVILVEDREPLLQALRIPVCCSGASSHQSLRPHPCKSVCHWLYVQAYLSR